MPEDPAARGTYVPRHGGPAMASTGYGSAGSDDVPAAVMAEGPLIEFAPSNEPPVKRRMKAKPLDSRATGVQATAPAGRPRPPREPAPAIEQAATDDSIAAIPDAGSESTVATSPPPAALEQPAAPSDALEAADETEAPQKGPKRGRWRNR